MMDEDEVISTIPIRFSNRENEKIHIHQFPLLTRPLEPPPSATASGKRIVARIKPDSHRLEVHVPADTRPDVWNVGKARELGVAQIEDDKEKNQEQKSRSREGEEPRLSEIRMQSEEISQRGVYMLGIVRDGELHLHPVSQTHQFRPTLTYLDVLSRKNRTSRGGDSDSDSDDGPPPDPDDPTPVPVVKKDRKTPSGQTREVQGSARKGDDRGGMQMGGLSAARKEMLVAIRKEEDEEWQNLTYYDANTSESTDILENLLSRQDEQLNCQSDITTFYTGGV